MKPLMLSLTLLLGGSSALAGGGGQMGMPMSMDMGMDAMVMQMRSMMRPMMAALEPLKGQAFDRAFLSMMIPHHASAIEMSRVALPRLKDAQVRTWAQQIIQAQQKEIAEMQAHLRTIGGADALRQGMMQRGMAGMDMPGMMKMASNTDRMFLEMMTPHHGGAVDMANLALQKSQDAFVLELAEQIVAAQAEEMHAFQDWLRTHR